MKFSVITPSLNCGPYILNNIRSVRQQGISIEDLEHWIIDGGSKDETIAILKQEQGIKWISEPDRGLSDVVNKGIRRAKGDWIIWLNADDSLAPDACNLFLDYTRRFPTIKIFCGAQTYLRYDGTTERIVPSWDYNLKELLGRRTGINQASTFIHREVYDKVGMLDVDNRYSMDYEWVVRAMHHYKCVAIPEVLTFYRRRKGSITDANMVKQFQDFLRVRREYKRPYCELAEVRIRFYLCTEWLRRIPALRRTIRRVKKVLGHEPLHPM